MHKLSENYILQNWYKFYDNMELSVQMRVIYNVKHCHVIHLKFGDKVLSFDPKLVVKAKSVVCLIPRF